MSENALTQWTVLLIAAVIPTFAAAAVPDARYDRDAAIHRSQSAVGQPVGDYELQNGYGQPVRLLELAAGKPLLVSMIFTSCHHVCPTTTKHLDEAVDAAVEALGEDAFTVVSVGFDTANDTPDAMSAFARRQGIDRPNWHFLSSDEATVKQLSDDLGFIYFPTPRGFDHLTQTTIVGRDGRVYSQVYGMAFELPWLVEPLKDLVFNRPSSEGRLFAGLVDRLMIFCTVYDPTTGRYRFDNSMFVQMAVGSLILIAAFTWVIREMRTARRAR